MKPISESLAERFQTLTQENIDYILSSDITDHFMFYGVRATLHIDPSLSLMDLWTVEGSDRVFPSKQSAMAECARLFVRDADPRTVRYVVAHEYHDGIRLYTQGMRGVGQEFGWWSTPDVEDAMWFDSLEAVMGHIRRYGLECTAAIIEEVKIHKLYHDLTGRVLYIR